MGNSPRFCFQFQDENANRIKIHPKVVIELIAPVGGIDGFAIADHPGHHAEDHIVGDVVFFEGVVISSDNISIIGSNLDDPVKYILGASFIVHCIVFFAALRAFFRISMMS